MSRGKASRVQHSGRVTVTTCRYRGQGLPCAPINRITVWDEKGRQKDHCTCTCGRRYRTGDQDAAEHLLEPLGPITAVHTGASAAWPASMLWPIDRQVIPGALGVAPLGTEALHRQTLAVGDVTDEVKALAKHMVKVMHQAPGVGLAANQVGMPVRMFCQVHRRAAPEVFVDPEIRATSSTWTYTEGCLSLEVDGSHAPLVRPKRVQVRARTLHGETFEITANEVLGRILQHEIDHLDGFMYLQRLAEPALTEVYERVADAGFDTSIVPPAPSKV